MKKECFSLTFVNVGTPYLRSDGSGLYPVFRMGLGLEETLANLSMDGAALCEREDTRGDKHRFSLIGLVLSIVIV